MILRVDAITHRLVIAGAVNRQETVTRVHVRAYHLEGGAKLEIIQMAVAVCVDIAPNIFEIRVRQGRLQLHPRQHRVELILLNETIAVGVDFLKDLPAETPCQAETRRAAPVARFCHTLQ